MCRCVISGLRYLFILHQDWLDSHWPEPRKLRQAELASVFGLLFLQISINTVTFMLLAKPYGWPQKSFFQSVPGPIQTTIILICLFVFLLPVKISIVFYLLLLKQRKTFETKNKVGIIETKTSISGSCATLGLDKTCPDQVQGSALGTGLWDADINLLVSINAQHPSSKSNSSRSSSPEVQSWDSNPGTEDLKSTIRDRDILEGRIQVNVAPDCNEGAVVDEPDGHDHEDVLARAGAVNGPKDWVEGPVDQSPDCSESESSDSGHRTMSKSPDPVNQTATQLVGAFCEGLLSKTNSIDVRQSQLQQEQQQQKPQLLENQEVEKQEQHPRQRQPFLVMKNLLMRKISAKEIQAMSKCHQKLIKAVQNWSMIGDTLARLTMLNQEKLPA